MQIDWFWRKEVDAVLNTDRGVPDFGVFVLANLVRRPIVIYGENAYIYKGIPDVTAFPG